MQRACAACCVGGVALWCAVAPYLFLLCGGVLSAGGVVLARVVGACLFFVLWLLGACLFFFLSIFLSAVCRRCGGVVRCVLRGFVLCFVLCRVCGFLLSVLLPVLLSISMTIKNGI